MGLIRPFEEEEVWDAVTCMAGDKSLGPDGFTMAFHHACWSVVKADVMQVFCHFQSQGTSARSLNFKCNICSFDSYEGWDYGGEGFSPH